MEDRPLIPLAMITELHTQLGKAQRELNIARTMATRLGDPELNKLVEVAYRFSHFAEDELHTVRRHTHG